MIENDKNTICELRVVCRSDDKQEYPFKIYTKAKYFYPTFDKAEAAIQRLVKEYAENEMVNVYHYCIYTYRYDAEITDLNRDSIDIATYLSDGSQWLGRGVKNIVRGGVYEFISGNSVHLCIIEDEEYGDNKCGYLELQSDYTHGCSYMSEIMPCSFHVPEEYIAALHSKYERYEEVEHKVLTPTFGLPYEASSIYDEDMNDYLYVPAAFSGFRYDLFFDCRAAYRKNMHPMWFYVAYPDAGKTVLLPITVSSDITLMWDKYEDVLDDLCIAEDLIDFITFNLQNIMELADYQHTPDYFLWNFMRVDQIEKLLNHEFNALSESF